jgi:hypothetical protein
MFLLVNGSRAELEVCRVGPVTGPDAYSPSGREDKFCAAPFENDTPPLAETDDCLGAPSLSLAFATKRR